MKAEEVFRDGAVEYKDGSVEMRLRLEPGVAVCLEWKMGDEWHEVCSMRPVAFDAFLSAYEARR